MDKLKMQTPNKADENFEKLAAMFPNAVTETIDENGEVVRAIDKDVLMQEINCKVVDGNEERYQFTWPDKKKSILAANAPINKTLRPCREESVDFDNTKNLYIEGDNLDVLKLLQETYLHSIDVIYIDPPYNTGNNLIYKNDFSQNEADFAASNQELDSDGNKLVKNLDTNGRFHTNWLNMIYPRLLLAKNLLKDTGVLICTIDQSELNTLGVILKQVFSNRAVTAVSIVHNPSGTQGNNFGFNNEFAFFVYDDTIRSIALEQRIEENADVRSFMNGAKGDTSNYLRSSGANTFYPVIVKENTIVGFGDVCPDEYHPLSSNVIQDDGTILVYPVDGDGIERKWLFERGTVENIIDELHVKYSSEKNLYEIVRVKSEINYKTVWTDKKYNAKTYGTLLIKELVGSVFSNPKSLFAVEECIKAVVHDKNDAIIMDFFSGSSTTAHAIMDLNASDGGRRKYIMVQLPENLDENLAIVASTEKKTIINAIKFCDELRKPHTIAEVAKERIRRAGAQIKNKIAFPQKEKQGYQLSSVGEQYVIDSLAGKKVLTNDANYLTENGDHITEYISLQNPADKYKYHPELLDVGFRVLKLDSSNMKDVYYNPADYVPSMFETLADNIKEDRTPEDLLFQVMLDLGIELSASIREETICGKKVFYVAEELNNFLIACFDADVTDEVITEIAKKKPYYFVMRDSSAADDSVRTNFEQIFETYSPDTVRKVL